MQNENDPPREDFKEITTRPHEGPWLVPQWFVAQCSWPRLVAHPPCRPSYVQQLCAISLVTTATFQKAVKNVKNGSSDKTAAGTPKI